MRQQLLRPRIATLVARRPAHLSVTRSGRAIGIATRLVGAVDAPSNGLVIGGSGRYAYVANANDSRIEKFDLVTGQTVDYLDYTGFGSAGDLVLRNGFAYLLDQGNSLLKIDLDTGRTVASYSHGIGSSIWASWPSATAAFMGRVRALRPRRTSMRTLGSWGPQRAPSTCGPANCGPRRSRPPETRARRGC